MVIELKATRSLKFEERDKELDSLVNQILEIINKSDIGICELLDRLTIDDLSIEDTAVVYARVCNAVYGTTNIKISDGELLW